jgi:bleomycin hydrolase
LEGCSNNKKIRIMSIRNQILVLVVILGFSLKIASAQDYSGYEFKKAKEWKNTAVKSQDRTGTCWSYATTSFLESEIIRLGGDEPDLSEMYFVRYAYENRARQYVMFHGKNNFGQGGQAHDVLNVVKEYGFVTEEAYPGIRYDSKIHNHSELSSVLEGFLDGLLKSRRPSTVWAGAYAKILDTYLGEVPETINYNGDQISPEQFALYTGIDASGYIEITSYSHAPFYEPFVLEVPDNWSHDLYYNLPLDEMMEVMDQALENGFTVCWDGDVSEKGFSHKDGIAAVPEEMSEDPDLSSGPVEEKTVDQEQRQRAFESFNSTDDHLMHITGSAFDKNGTGYYLTKNSWGEESNEFGGKLYMSTSYVRLHTIAIMVHKDAVPDDIKHKLGL